MHKLKTITTLLIILSLLPFLTGCAWENLPEEGVTPDLRLRITMSVQGTLDPTHFYFFVFNFSGIPDNKPKPKFEDDERGLHWDAYYMYGNPQLTGLDYWRGVAGITKAGYNRLDLRPIPSYSMFEYVSISVPKPGVTPTGDQLVLELDFGKRKAPNTINMNMMVSNLPFDRIDNPDDLYDATIFDSFLFDGVTLNLAGSDTIFREEEFKVEEQENIGENPSPNDNIVSWKVQLL
jgi:hypothetical protein